MVHARQDPDRTAVREEQARVLGELDALRLQLRVRLAAVVGYEPDREAGRALGDQLADLLGGATRQESTYNGLVALGEVDSVIVHESVRPLVSVDDFRRLMAVEDENAMFGSPIPFIVLKGHEYVEGLLERDELVNVQLPQKFNRAALLAAHEKARAEGVEFTEDASLLFAYGGAVRILPGMDHNIKITVPTDTVTAEAIYADLMGRRS